MGFADGLDSKAVRRGWGKRNLESLLGFWFEPLGEQCHLMTEKTWRGECQKVDLESFVLGMLCLKCFIG